MNSPDTESGKPITADESSQALRHYLLLAAAQIRNKLSNTNTYSDRVRSMRILEELIREQMPNENASHSTGTTR